MIKVKPCIAKMATYKPPWTNMDRSGYLRLDLNENTLNPPEHVNEALKSYINANRIMMYPDYDEFMPKLAAYTGVHKDRLMVTNGSDQAIEVILRAFLGDGDKMLMAQPGFPMFDQIAGVIGAKICGIPYWPDMNFPENKFLEAIENEKPDLVVLVNPDNPTGIPVALSFIGRVLEMIPDIPVFVDEAYFEFTGKTALELMHDHPNMIITRTFSKAFAMAGLRMGYIIAHPDIIAEFSKIRGPFDVNSLALVAAEAQIEKQNQWREFVSETMTASKPELENFFNRKQVKYYPGAANFMLVAPKDRDRAVQFLKDQDILVRPMTAPSIAHTFRMNVGVLKQTRSFIDSYDRYLNLYDGEPG
ncbi:histidinol-phosphate transaminase [Desulfobacterales bacterium HSG16]|nr:histidinol-phosphate transaminase [Desulfobacterales bacterium HSG16]